MILLAILIGGMIVGTLWSIYFSAMHHTPADFGHHEVSNGEMRWVEQ